MPLPVDVVIENCHATVGTTGLVPIDGAVQWTDPPGALSDFTTYRQESGASVVEPLGPLDPLTHVTLDLGSKGNFPCYLGSMASQTTRRVHIPGVPLSPGERVLGTIESGTIASTTFANPGDGLALLGADRPELEMDGTPLSPLQTVTRDFNPYREVVELEGRDATYGVWYQFRLRFWPTVRRVGWTMTATFTDERISDRVIAWPVVKLKVPSTWQVHIDNAARVFGEASYLESGSRLWDLMSAHTIHDAQSMRYKGTFLLPSASEAEVSEWGSMPGYRTGVPRMMAQPEEYRGKLFFCDGLPARPKQRDEATCRDRYELFRKSVEDRDVGNNDYVRLPFDSENKNRAREAASQPDFGALPGYELFWRENGNPLRLPELDAAGDRHMARPITQRRRGLDEVNTLNARPVQWGDYPAKSFILQGEYIFFRVTTGTTDVRGKSLEAPNNAARYYQGMTGLLRSHHSHLHAIEAMLFGGCFDAEDIVRAHIEWFLYEWIADKSVYHARATQVRFARALDSMCWAWLCTGDARIPGRMTELADIADLVWERYYDMAAANHPFRWLGLNSTNETVTIYGESRTMRGTTADPWQVSLCSGYYHAYKLTGDDFYLDITKDLTRTWAYTWRFGRWHDTQLRLRGPEYRQMFKLIFPGLNGNPGTYGQFPPAEWLTEKGERTYWRAFADVLWTPHMLCIGITVHENERATKDLLSAILGHVIKPWLDAGTLGILDSRGEWFGDDEKIPGFRDPGGPITVLAPEARENVSEPGFTFDADQGVGFTLFVDPETSRSSVTAATISFGDLELVDREVGDEIVEYVREPQALIDMDDEINIVTPAEVVRETVTTATLQIAALVLTAPAAAEDVTEPTATVIGGSEGFAAGAAVETVSEPDFVFENKDNTASRTSAVVRAESGASEIEALAGAQEVKARSTA